MRLPGALALAAMGCATTGVPASFLTGRSSEFPEDRYIVGVGAASGTVRQAELEARQAVAEQVRSQVRAQSTGHASGWVERGDDTRRSGSAERIASEVSTVAEFRHAELIRTRMTHVDPDTLKAYALVALDRREAERTLGEELRSGLADVQAQQSGANGSDGALARTVRLSAALHRARELLPAAMELQAIARAPRRDLTELRELVRSLDREAEQAAAAATWFVAVEGQDPGVDTRVIEGVLGDALREAGFRLTDAEAGAAIVLRGSIETEYGTLDAYQTCRPRLVARALDVRSGDVVLELEIGSGTETRAAETTRDRAALAAASRLRALAGERMRKWIGRVAEQAGEGHGSR